MANSIINLRDKLRTYKFKFKLLQKIPCSSQENVAYFNLKKAGGSLPQGVYTDTYNETEFYTIYEPDLSEAEVKEYLTLKKLSILNTIKNCVVFFTVLTIISIVVYFVIATSAF